MNKKKKYIGLMDPNYYSFLRSIENLIDFIKPEIKVDKETYEIVTGRVKCEPYDTLNTKTNFDVIMNRGTHWNPHRNSFFSILSPKIHFIYNMYSFKTIDKNAGYAHMSHLGLNIPPTWAIPPKEYPDIDEPKSKVTIHKDLIFEDHELFDLKKIGDTIGYPAFLKPQDGGGWVGVERVNNAEELIKAYNNSGDKPMNLQKAVDYREFVRSVGVGPQVMPMHYNATSKYSHDRYIRSEEKAIEHDFITEAEKKEVIRIVKIINAFYGWDHNSCESLISKEDGKIYVIDFANAYPDSSIVSLHYYFPELVKSMVKWLIFCSIYPRVGKLDFMSEWPKYFKILEEANKKDLTYEEKLVKYEKLADKYFDTEKFEEFCQKNLSHLDEVALEFFGSKTFEDIIVETVKRYFTVPSEIAEKIEHYKGLNNFWLHCEKNRLKKS